MKRINLEIILSFAFLFAIILPASAIVELGDTTFVYKGKLIKVSDSIDQVKVKVLDAKRPNDTAAYKQVYEGIFSEGKSYETWSVIESFGLQLPNFTKSKSKRNSDSKHTSQMEPHYAGFGLAFSNLIDGSQLFPYQSSKKIPLKADQSTEWFINVIEHCYPIYRNRLGITTGLGMSWNTYRLDNNKHLVVNPATGITELQPAPTGDNYIYSRLKVVHLTVPVLLEWQPGFIRGSFLSAGVVAGIKTYSSYRVKFTNSSGDEIKRGEGRGLNTNPISLDLMAQAGIGSIGFFAKYGLVDVFQEGKADPVRSVSLGVMLHF